MKRPKFFRRVRWNETLSPYYGVCWVDNIRAEVVSCPIVLNVAVYYWHRLRCWCKHPINHNSRFEQVRRRALSDGYAAGLEAAEVRAGR